MTNIRFTNGTSDLSHKHTGWLRRASIIAEASTYKFRHGSVIVRGGSVISVGVNTRRNDPTIVPNPKTDASIHAEVAAIRAVRGTDLKNATLYVARILTNGEQAMSKPCDNCVAEIRAAGIRKVVYTIDSMMELD